MIAASSDAVLFVLVPVLLVVWVVGHAGMIAVEMLRRLRSRLPRRKASRRKRAS